jgi:hypothetical protein
MSLSKTDYLLNSLSKLVHKKWELYIVSRIIHRLNDDKVEFVTQQLVRFNDGTRALTDLYFPQFGIHLEIDEPHHDRQFEVDLRRQQDIVNTTDHSIERIKITDGDGVVRSLDSINSDVEELIYKIKRKKSEFEKIAAFVPWDFDRRFSPELTIQRGKVSVAENSVFQKQIDAMRCFGFKGRGWQKGEWNIPDETGDSVWFPRLYEHGIWNNELTADGKTIYERAINDNSNPKGYLKAMESLSKQRKRWKDKPKGRAIVFAKAHDPLGGNLLRYVGSFQMDLNNSSANALAFTRVAEEEDVRTTGRQGAY